jgi:hypothetical protein
MCVYIYIFTIVDMYHVSFNNSVYIYNEQFNIIHIYIYTVSNYLWKFSTVLYVYSHHDCDYQTEMHIQVNISAKQLLENSACGILTIYGNNAKKTKNKKQTWGVLTNYSK